MIEVSLIAPIEILLPFPQTSLKEQEQCKLKLQNKATQFVLERNILSISVFMDKKSVNPI